MKDQLVVGGQESFGSKRTHCWSRDSTSTTRFFSEIHVYFTTLSNFHRTSVRTLGVYVIDGAKVTLKSEISTTTSPATLIPHFDPDTNLVYVSGKVSKLRPFLSDNILFSCVVRETPVSWPTSMLKMRAHFCFKCRLLPVDQPTR